MDRGSTRAFGGASVLLDRDVRDRLRLAWRLMRDERVSAVKFAVPVLIVIYVLSPVDSIPDVFLGLGQMDDLGVVAAGLLILARVIPWLATPDVVGEHMRDMHLSGRVAKTPEDTHGVVEARFTVRD